MNILIVEDNKPTLRLLEKKINTWGYSVHLAENGIEALAKLASSPIDIVLTDWNMPEMNGLELCRRVRKSDMPYIYLIVVTARDSRKDIVHGLESGADDYVTKPINFDELRARMGIGVRIVRMERDLDQRYTEIKRNYFQTIQMFISFIETFDEDLGGHCKRVAQLSLRLAKWFPDLSEEDLNTLESAGLLHDIGMVGLPNEMASKRGVEMNGDEMHLYHTHPIAGEIILNEIEFLRPVAKLVRSHHEQFNGRGFPDGVEGSKIPPLNKILAAAVSYDDLAHKWKTLLGDIPDKLQRMRGYELEPAIVDYLLEINSEDIRKEEEEDLHEIALDDLREGMRLAKGIRRDSGALVMPAETALTRYSIEKLIKFSELNCVKDKAYVYK
jgi:putative two-component system response regulator